MSDQRPWHRLFGLSLMDFFRGLPVLQRVYAATHFSGVIRVIVVHELPQEEHNSLLHLFSARKDLLQYGATHYRLRSDETSTLLLQLFKAYRLEATLMPDALEEL